MENHLLDHNGEYVPPFTIVGFSDNHLLDNNVNTLYLYQIYQVILSSFLGIPSEFCGKLDSITRYIFKRSIVFLQNVPMLPNKCLNTQFEYVPTVISVH